MTWSLRERLERSSCRAVWIHGFAYEGNAFNGGVLRISRGFLKVCFCLFSVCFSGVFNFWPY